MGNQKNTIATEDAHYAPFFNKTPISIERGEGLYVWDEEGNGFGPGRIWAGSDHGK